MNRRTDAWQNACFRKMDDHLVPITPIHHPSKLDVLPKHFIQIIFTAKWLVRHSILSTKQQRRPLPSLLSVSSSMHKRQTETLNIVNQNQAELWWLNGTGSA